jgi:hypothetical protein
MRLRIHRAAQPRCGILDVRVAVLSGPAFGRQHRAPINLREISARKPVALLGVPRLRVVDSQVPFPIRREAVPPDEPVCVFGGRFVFAPHVAVVAGETAGTDEAPTVIERSLVEFHSHDCVIRCWCLNDDTRANPPTRARERRRNSGPLHSAARRVSVQHVIVGNRSGVLLLLVIPECVEQDRNELVHAGHRWMLRCQSRSKSARSESLEHISAARDNVDGHLP